MFTKKPFGIGLAVGLLALAFAALPAMASAAELTDEAGAVPVGEEIRAESGNTTTKTAVGELKCKKVNIGGEVTTNSGGTVTLAMLPASEEIAQECVRSTPLGEEAVTVSATFTHLHLSPETNTAVFDFSVKFPGLGGLVCNFEGTVAASAIEGGAKLNAKGTVVGTSAEPCPKGGEFNGDFALSDSNGAVTID
jgi:hypothetical protein